MGETREILGVKLYTTDEAAQILKLHRFTVLKHIKTGKLKAQKIGHGWKIAEENIRAFVLGE